MSRTFSLADLFEIVVDACPDRLALVAGPVRLSYRELDERGNRLAHHLLAAGIGSGDHVAVWARNRAEWVEAMLGCFKARAVPVNVNFRYVAPEIRYLLADAGAAALIVERSFLPILAQVRSALPALRHVLLLDDGVPDENSSPLLCIHGRTTPGVAPVYAEQSDCVDYESALAAASAGRDFPPRSGDDRYVLYTGGTTGMPKGVVWRGEDLFFAALSGSDPGGQKITAPEAVAARALEEPDVRLGIAPMMHGNGQWAALNPLTAAGTAVLWTRRRFDPAGVLELMAVEHVTTAVLVGDAMARPLVETLAAAPEKYDLSSLRLLGSGGAVLSPSIRQELERLLPGCVVIDAFGASETGSNGRLLGAGRGDRGTFTMNPGVTVLDDRLEPVSAGQTGRLAVSGHIPLGYHGDPVKTTATFPTDRAGVRWAVPGDHATLHTDGSVTLLGRGSVSINTGGEKVFPEEVEAALKAHPGVFDTLVVGVPDEVLGRRVVAVVQPRPGPPPSLESVQQHARGHLAGYKIPRALVIVEEIVRSPAGKPDYRWAAETAAISEAAATPEAAAAHSSASPECSAEHSPAATGYADQAATP